MEECEADVSDDLGQEREGGMKRWEGGEETARNGGDGRAGEGGKEG